MSERLLGEAQPLGLRLFLEGIEVPVVAATVDINEGAAAVAQIEIVALDSAFALKPRTVAHLFFFDGDAHKYGPKGQSIDSLYKVLFSGEVFSYSFQKSGGGSRSFILNCIDFSNYWDTSYIFQVSDTDELLDVPQIQPFITGSDVFADTVGGHKNNIALLIDFLSKDAVLSHAVPPAPPNVSYLSRLMSFAELLGGVSVLDDDLAVPEGEKTAIAQRMTIHGGMNAWHTVTERRVRLLDQIAVDDGRTASATFQQDGLIKFLKGQSDLSSSVLSFRDILNLLMGHIYYTAYPNPCARLLTGQDAPLTPLTPGSSPGSSGGGGKWPTGPIAYKVPSGLQVNPQFLPKRTTVDVSGAAKTDTQTVEGLAAERTLFSSDSTRPKLEAKWAYEQLSANFTYTQMTPPNPTTKNPSPSNYAGGVGYYNFLRDLCLYVIEDAWDFLFKKYRVAKPYISSGFRSDAANASLGPRAAPNSFHKRGMAVDLDFAASAKVLGKSTADASWEVYKILRLEWLPQKQEGLVGEMLFECMAPNEPGWVHMGLGNIWGGPPTWPGVGIPESRAYTDKYGIPVIAWPNIGRNDPRPGLNVDVIAAAIRDRRAKVDAKKAAEAEKKKASEKK